LGTVIYYIFDSVLLAAAKSKAYDLWIHHITAITFFSCFLLSGLGESGGMYILLAEVLVPTGFALFYLKLNKLRAHPLFRLICYQGLATIIGRVSIWAFLIYRLNIVEPHLFPAWLANISNATFGFTFFVELFWANLYYGNLKRGIKEAAELKKAGKSYPSLGSVFQ